ncbi:hypothetical protein K474DRAFT_1344567 [Panus rudis PR-1116 ss-1]|nr:hypothetical protein K474DRAFT_1344567 [Panus rudis PR-1116 ss-1]
MLRSFTYHVIDDKAELFPFWAFMSSVALPQSRAGFKELQEHITQDDETAEAVKQAYMHFRKSVPADSIKERIFRYTRTIWSCMDERYTTFVMLAPALYSAGCRDRDVDICIEYAAGLVHEGYGKPLVDYWPQRCAMAMGITQLLVRRAILVRLSAAIGIPSLLAIRATRSLGTYHAIEEPLTMDNPKAVHDGFILIFESIGVSEDNLKSHIFKEG